MLGFCPSCEVHTQEDACWCCGQRLLYGVPVHITAHHSYCSTAQATILQGRSVLTGVEVDHLI